MAGISNVTIEEFIEEDDDFKKNFVGVFLYNRTTTSIIGLQFFEDDKKKRRILSICDIKYR